MLVYDMPDYEELDDAAQRQEEATCYETQSPRSRQAWSEAWQSDIKGCTEEVEED